MPPTPDHLLQLAITHHQAGRLTQAEEIYRQILATHPNHPDALHLLGVIAGQTSRPALALDLIQRAIAISPNNPDYHFDLHNVLRTMGQRDEAILSLQRAAALRPEDFETHFYLAQAFHAQKHFDQAIASYQRIIALKPDLAPAHANLGNVLRDKGLPDQAIKSYENAIALNPQLLEAHTGLGNAWLDKLQLDKALQCQRNAIAINPNHHIAHNNLGTVLTELRQLDQAIASHRTSISLRPDYAEGYCNLALALQRNLQFDDAILAYQKAINLNPKYADAFRGLAHTCKEQGRMDETIAALRQAIQIDPQFPNYHSELGLALLAVGNFTEGWDQYEWRWKCAEFKNERVFRQPLWQGEDRQTILLTMEQGFGDAIQFLRYVPLVAARCKRILLGCRQELLPLLQNLPHISALISIGSDLSPFDAHCPLLTLPKIFNTTLDTIPSQVPYLTPDPALVAQWAAKLPRDSRRKIGLAWAGSPAHKADRQRSIPLAAFAPLATIKDALFYSLQKGPARLQVAQSQAATPPPGLNLIDLTQDLHTFADTAALIANLDLIISVDTAIVHLAGAMAKQVWTLLPFAPDWRWLMNRPTSPWYPTMRLFRQPAPEDWASVIQQIANDLKSPSHLQSQI